MLSSVPLYFIWVVIKNLAAIILKIKEINATSIEKIIDFIPIYKSPDVKKYLKPDDVLAERMDEILEIFDGVLVSNKLDVPLGHPIRTYLDEVEAIRIVLNQIINMIEKKFIKNQWAEIYDKLEEINIHFARKQNQLYPSLESRGFDKPSKVMWTLENNIKDIIIIIIFIAIPYILLDKSAFR